MSKSISEIKQIYNDTDINDIPLFIEALKDDDRKGVLNIVSLAEKKYNAHLSELKRLEEISFYENECRKKGFKIIAGIDEVGRGPLAGPVVTAAVILEENCKIEGINDSKKLSAAKREALYDIIIKEAVAYCFGIVSPEEID